MGCCEHIFIADNRTRTPIWNQLRAWILKTFQMISGSSWLHWLSAFFWWGMQIICYAILTSIAISKTSYPANVKLNNILIPSWKTTIKMICAIQKPLINCIEYIQTNFYHGNCPGAAAWPPMIRVLMEMPQLSWFINFNFFNRKWAARDGNVVTSIAGFGNAKLGPLSKLLWSNAFGLKPLFPMKWKSLIGLTCSKCGGIWKSGEKLGGQLRNVRGSSKSK